jgi:RNA-directed DNA polymerase
MPGVKFYRYADDGVIHMSSEGLDKQMILKLRQRLTACKLDLYPDKTRIVYCCDQNRPTMERPSERLERDRYVPKH